MKLLVFLILFLLSACQSGTLSNHRTPSYKSTDPCNISLQKIFALRNKFKPPAYNFRSQQRSLSRSIPDYREKIRLLEGSIPGVRPFVQLFHEEFGRNPTNKEIIQYFKNSIKVFADIVNQFFGHGELTDQFTRQAFDIVKIETRYLELLEDFQKKNQAILNEVYHPDHFNHYATIRAFKGFYYGMVGEFDIAMRLRGTLAINLFLNEEANLKGSFAKPFSKHLNQIIEKRFNHLKNLSKSDREEVLKKYPHLFKPNRFQKGEDILESTLVWLQQKEIDLVVYDGKKYRFIEVKNLSKVANERSIKKKSGNKKSQLEQSLQMREIIDFLNISHEVDVEIFFRRGIEAEAAQLFEEKGIIVRGVNKKS